MELESYLTISVFFRENRVKRLKKTSFAVKDCKTLIFPLMEGKIICFGKKERIESKVGRTAAFRQLFNKSFLYFSLLVCFHSKLFSQWEERRLFSETFGCTKQPLLILMCGFSIDLLIWFSVRKVQNTEWIKHECNRAVTER